MAVTPVSLSPSLRAWSLAGLTHLLFDEPVVPPTLGGLPLGTIAPLATGNLASGGPQSALSKTFTGASAAPGALVKAAASAPSTLPTPPLSFASRNGVSSCAADWPSAWGDWIGKVSPAPVLWTYHELGADLTGLGRSTERSAFLKALMSELRLSKGSSVFWPCAMPIAGETPGSFSLEANAPLFTAGMDRLSPQLLVVFGEKAMTDMALAGENRYFHQVMVEGKLLVVLPEIIDLIEGAAQRSSAVSLLRAVLLSLRFG